MTPDEFDELARAEDYRSIPRLTAMVFDATLPESTRDTASRVLAGFDDTTTGEQHRTWWASADPVVRRHALRFMTRAEADIVVAVASDDAHPWQALALRRMSFGFCEAEFVPVLVRALAHEDPKVRLAAAEEPLFWNEPLAAETGLLAAVRDEAVEVALAALDTLRYYPTQRVLCSVEELRSHPDERISAAATVTFDDLRETFESAVSEGEPKTVELLRRWMRPVYDLVGWPESITVLESRPPLGHQRRPGPPAAALLALLDEPYIDQEDLYGTLGNVDWSAYDSATRTTAISRLTAHPNPVVRGIGCYALAAWGRTDELMRLAGDRSAGVRKSAVYTLASLPANPAVAELTWRYLPNATGMAAQEAVKTHVAHMGSAATDRLVELVRSDPRTDVRYAAIDALVKLQAGKEIHSLADLLAEPPGVHWSVHTSLLHGLRELGIATPLPAHLEAVDDLHVQRALAGYTASQS